MTATVVVLGAGYAGAGAIPRLEAELDDAEIVWVSEHDYHLVLHESHRLIRDPAIREKITIPVEDIKSPGTEFVRGRVTGLDTQARLVHLADGREVGYDYLLVALGSKTAFYGIPGLRANAHTLKGLDDALAVHEAVRDATGAATQADPATVVVGGAGLSGIQSAGEVAEFRDAHDAPVEVVLVEALDTILPNGDPALQELLRKHLDEADVQIRTGDPITEADDATIYFDEGDPLDYDVFLWTGGVSGHDCIDDCGVANRHNRLTAASTFRTSDRRVFAIGDAAIVEQGEDSVAPPTALAAWQAAEVAAENVARAIDDRLLREWTYDDQGTLVSVGEDAVAHGVKYLPVGTFDAAPARFLK